MLINRITSVVAAIFVFICLLITTISGKSLPPRTLSTSQHLMIDNSSHDIWFGLTSVSHFRPDQSDLTETMSVSRPNRVQRSGTNQVTAFDSEHSEENLKPDTRIPDTSPSSTLEHSSNHPLRSSQSSQQNNFISKPFLFTSDHDGVSSGGNTSGKSHSKINLNLNGDANHDVPSTSPFAPITSTSRISHILKRDISNDLELDYDTSPVKFYSRCSKHPLYLDQKGHFRADNKSRSRDTHFRFLKSKDSGFGLFSLEYGKFICHDPETGKLVPKSCFNRTLCQMEEFISNNYFSFRFTSNHKRILAIDRRGRPINFYSPRYSMERVLQCRHFMKESSQHQPKWDYVKDIKYAESLNCSDWEKTGEQIFRNEIIESPDLESNLSKKTRNSNSKAKQSDTVALDSTRPAGLNLKLNPEIPLVKREGNLNSYLWEETRKKSRVRHLNKKLKSKRQ